MSEKTKKNVKKEDLFRVVILNEATFEEKLSIKYSKNKLIAWISAAIILLFILFLMMISFSPLKRLIPGYASIENNVWVIKMNSYVNDLEKQIDLQEKYNNSLRKLLVGQGDSILLTKDHNNNNNILANANDAQNNYDEIYSLERKKVKSYKKRKNSLGAYYFIPPLTGKVNNSIDFEKGHYGVDIAGIKNAPIKAIMEGIVVFSDYATETGYTIAIQHPNDMLSIYKHNDKLLKDIGYFVANGEAIAIIGNTGTLTDGPHLHFELWYKSTPLNPEDYILFDKQ